MLVSNNCNSSKKAQMNKKEEIATPRTNLGGTYTVIALYGEEIVDSKLTMTIDPTQKKITGFSGCNTYSCSYQVNDKTFSSSLPSMTKKFCVQTESLEKKFMKALKEVKIKESKGSTLNFLNETSSIVISATKN